MAALSCLVPAGSAWGQHVRGSVVDDETRRRVVDATLELVDARGDTIRTASDSAGRFALTVPRAGVYRLTVSHVAFAAFADSIDIATGEVITLQIRLGRQAVPLEPLVVTGRRNERMRGFDERMRAGIGHFITRDAIQARRAARVSDLLRDVPGLVFPRSGPSGALILVRSAGSRSCQPSIWLDGVEVRQYAGSTMDDILTPNVLEAVEIYTTSSGAPSQWITGACGVIAFWTRQGSGEDGQPWQWKKALIGLGAAAVLLLLFR